MRARPGRVLVRGPAIVRRQIGTTVVGMVLAAGLLAGCGGNGAGSASGATATRPAAPSLGTVTTGPGGVQQVTLQTEDDYVFTPDRFTVAPGKVRLTVRNVAEQMTHSFRFSAGGGPAALTAHIPILPPGQQQTIDFTVQTPGDYRFECSFHVQLGQVGTMTVRG
jgi:plastocyanin